MSDISTSSENIEDLNQQLSVLDKQIFQLQEARLKIQKKKESNFKDGLTTLMNESKRKRNKSILDDEDYKGLQTLLKKSKQRPTISNIIDEEEKVSEAVESGDIGDLVGLDRKNRKTYSEAEKAIFVKLKSKFSYGDITNATGCHKNNLKRWIKDVKEGKVVRKRGRRMISPELDQELKVWVKLEQEKYNHISVRRLIVTCRKKQRSSTYRTSSVLGVGSPGF